MPRSNMKETAVTRYTEYDDTQPSVWGAGEPALWKKKKNKQTLIFSFCWYLWNKYSYHTNIKLPK